MKVLGMARRTRQAQVCGEDVGVAANAKVIRNQKLSIFRYSAMRCSMSLA